MKQRFDYEIRIFGETLKPIESKTGKYKSINIVTEDVLYQITDSDNQLWSVVLSRIGDPKYWAASVYKGKITLTEFKNHKHIAPPDFNISFACEISEIDQEVEDLITNFSRSDAIQNFIRNSITQQYI